MVQRKCPKCEAIFDRKSSFDKHINKKFDCSLNKNNSNETNNNDKDICENLPIFAKIYKNLPKFTNSIINEDNTNKLLTEQMVINNKNNINNDLFCSYCQKKFITKYTLERHIKEVCRVKKLNDEEKENIFKLLLEKDKQKDIEINELKKKNELFEKQNKMLIDKIDKLININSKQIKTNTNSNNTIINTNSNNTTNTTNTTNTNNITNTQNNIMMVNFGKEDLSIIDEKQFIERIVKKPTVSGVKIPDEVLQRGHF